MSVMMGLLERRGCDKDENCDDGGSGNSFGDRDSGDYADDARIAIAAEVIMDVVILTTA